MFHRNWSSQLATAARGPIMKRTNFWALRILLCTWNFTRLCHRLQNQQEVTNPSTTTPPHPHHHCRPFAGIAGIESAFRGSLVHECNYALTAGCHLIPASCGDGQWKRGIFKCGPLWQHASLIRLKASHFQCYCCLFWPASIRGCAMQLLQPQTDVSDPSAPLTIPSS